MSTWQEFPTAMPAVIANKSIENQMSSLEHNQLSSSIVDVAIFLASESVSLFVTLLKRPKSMQSMWKVLSSFYYWLTVSLHTSLTSMPMLLKEFMFLPFSKDISVDKRISEHMKLGKSDYNNSWSKYPVMEVSDFYTYLHKVIDFGFYFLFSILILDFIQNWTEKIVNYS